MIAKLDGKGGGGKGQGVRGRHSNRTGPSPRSSSRLAGEPSSDELYAAVREIAGPNLANLMTIVNALSKYFTNAGHPEPFRRDPSGALYLPLRLNNGYKWKAEKDSINFDIRRDRYAMWQFLRDISTGGTPTNKHSHMTKTGTSYVANNNVKDWKVLSTAEFEAMYKPAASLTPIKPVMVKIKGEQVARFMA